MRLHFTHSFAVGPLTLAYGNCLLQYAPGENGTTRASFQKTEAPDEATRTTYRKIDVSGIHA